MTANPIDTASPGSKAPKASGKPSPYAGKSIKRTTDLKKGVFPAVEGLKNPKQKAVFNAILGTIGGKKAIKVEAVLGLKVAYTKSTKDKVTGEWTVAAKEVKISSALVEAALHLGVIALV
jgi:hypothetical protein